MKLTTHNDLRVSRSRIFGICVHTPSRLGLRHSDNFTVTFLLKLLCAVLWCGYSCVSADLSRQIASLSRILSDHRLYNRIWVPNEVFLATSVSSESLNRWTSNGVFLNSDMYLYYQTRVLNVMCYVHQAWMFVFACVESACLVTCSHAPSLPT